MSTTPEFDSKRPILAKRLRDVGLLAAIVGTMIVGYMQFRAAIPSQIEMVAVTTLTAAKHHTAVGTNQNVARARLADGSEVDVLLPVEVEAKAGEQIEVEKLTMPDSSIHYRASTKVRTGR